VNCGASAGKARAKQEGEALQRGALQSKPRSLMDKNSQVPLAPLFPADAVPRGFRFAAVRAGIKASGNPDLACAVLDQPAAAAAMFTSNRIVAAPLTVGKRHLERGEHRLRAVLVNAGNANCATGEAGILAAERVCEKAGEIFGCGPDAVFPSSTGIIGVPLPQEKLIAALPALHAALGSSAAHLEQMARAIMTTDTVVKAAFAQIEIQGHIVRLAGIAKGAGMIFPRLTASPHATMLVYLFTDAAIEPPLAAEMLHHAVEKTFNRISIDGDTSTNDTVLLLASGASGVSIAANGDHSSNAPTGAPGKEAAPAFLSAIESICLSLAKQVVGDGEGIQHVVELNISGAPSDEDALRIARSIAHSPLVKTAWAGCDPNWGRILAAVGYSGVPIDPSRISIDLGDLELCRAGCVSPLLDKAAAHQYLKQRELSIRVDLGLGEGRCRFWTTDLTAEYVAINADYST
jgi:glutamate N-acetyltransferase/amino-acid N-acetyltransferase